MPTGEVVDRGDGRPIARVVVSDGLVVTRTDDDGTFFLPDRGDAEFVWVTVPSSRRALGPGWFVDVRGGTPDALRFELASADDPSGQGCRFVQVTDLHLSVDGGARLRPLIESGVDAPPGIEVTGATSAAELRSDLEVIIERVAPDFIVATGDLADYGQHEELVAYRDAITGLGVPVASVPGNHDHLSCLTRHAIDEFFAEWTTRGDTEDEDAGEAFQREVFGGDWRRPTSGRAPWVEEIGPLYYSFDWGGVHFVAYDGEGLRRYGADYPQDEWLAADLSLVAPETPVVVCTHFPETREFYRSRFGTVRLVASFSGHWHGTRLWRDGEAQHWTSSTLGFGGIDFTPRGYRVIEVDAHGARSRWHTVEEPSASPHDVAVACGVTGSEGVVFTLDVNASVRALDATTGKERWSRMLGDPSVRWTLGVPCRVDDRVYVGSAMSVHALDAATGAQLWRSELAAADWAASWSGVTATPDTVVVGGMSDDLHIAALDADTGEVQWRHAGRDIAGVCATPVIVETELFALHAPGWLVAYTLGDGTCRWRAPLEEAWPVALAASGDVALVRAATGTVTAHAIEDGAVRWRHPLGPGRRAGRPYSRAPGGARLPLIVYGDQIWTATFDELVGLDIATGALVTRVAADVEIATVVVLDDQVVALTVNDSTVAPG